MPVTGSNCLLDLGLSRNHSAADTVVNARRICNDERRTIIALRLSDSFDCLIVISTHSYLCNIYIAIAHCDTSEVFLFDFLTSCSKLGNSTCRCSLGRLSACIGVNLSIKYEDIDVFSGSKNVVDTAETNIIAPAVSAERPDRLLSKNILLIKNLFEELGVRLQRLKACNQCSSRSLIGFAVILGIKEFLDNCFNSFIIGFLSKSFYFADSMLTACILCKEHTEAILCVIFEQGVCPCRSAAFFICCVRSRRCAGAPN